MDVVCRNVKLPLFSAALRKTQSKRRADCPTIITDQEQQDDGGDSGGDDDDDDGDGGDGYIDRALLRLSPSTSASTYLSLLATFCRNKSLPHVKQVYAYLSLQSGHHLGGILSDYLVMSLAKCGGLDDALCLASTLPCITIFSWTAMITGFADAGRASEALNLYHHMQSYGLEPDSFTFVGLFKACSIIADLEKGSKLHAHARSKGLSSNPYVGNAIVTMYFKCRAFKEAYDAFDDLSCHNTFAWNRVISELVEHGEEHKALQLYKQMREEGVDPDTFTLVNLLKACGTISSIEEGKKLHVQAQYSTFLSNLFVGNTVVNMYRKCGALKEAEYAFYALQNRDMVSWNGMISAYVEQSQPIKALHLYRQMREESIYPDQATFIIVIQACIYDGKNEEVSDYLSKRLIKDVRIAIGQGLHADILRECSNLDVLSGTAVLSMYSRFRMIREAESVFSRMAQLDTAAWNAMLSAYVEQGQGEKALLLYTEMHRQGSDPNHITFMTALHACSTFAGKEVTSVNGISNKIISLEIGRALHEDINKGGYAKDTSIANTLTSMYGRCGSIPDAENVFSQVQCYDTISCNSMLSAYVELGQEGKAMLLYRKMKEDDIVIDDVTHLCVLQACSESGSLEICMELHFNIVICKHDGINSVVSTLITAYGSCARTIDAHETFHNMSELDVVLCNAYISGYTGEGNAIASVHAFESMEFMGIYPDVVTFISILSVFSHAGLVIEGLKCLNSMKGDYDIGLERTHYKIMIDLLGRAGDFKRIENMFSHIPMQNDPAIWLCLLGTSSTRGNFDIAKHAFRQVVRLKPGEARAYVLMSNVYVDGIGSVDLDEIVQAIECVDS